MVGFSEGFAAVGKVANVTISIGIVFTIWTLKNVKF